MKNIQKILLFILVAVVFMSCEHDDCPPNPCPSLRTFGIVKFSKPEYSQYVTSNVGAFRHEYHYVGHCYIQRPNNIGVYYEYLQGCFPSRYYSGEIFVVDSFRFDLYEPDGIYYPLNDGYFLQYPYVVSGKDIVYDIKWTDVDSFGIDLTRYDTLCVYPVEEEYFIHPPRRVRTFVELVNYCNETIDKGDLQTEWKDFVADSTDYCYY